MFKRNQVEEAITKVFEPASARPRSETRTRIKRLLETDRGLGRNKRSSDPERANFAFYSHEAPGRGMENWFSGYEAFALLVGLRLMQWGLPQGLVVSLLRRVRGELEESHAQILSQDPAVLFDAERIRQRARPGEIAVDSTEPVFLTIRTSSPQSRTDLAPAAICRGQMELMTFMMSHGAGHSFTSHEIGTSAHALSSALAQTRSSKRGRGGR